MTIVRELRVGLPGSVDFVNSEQNQVYYKVDVEWLQGSMFLLNQHKSFPKFREIVLHNLLILNEN